MANKSWIYQEYLPVIHYKTLGDPYATTLGNNRDVCMYVCMFIRVYIYNQHYEILGLSKNNCIYLGLPANLSTNKIAGIHTHKQHIHIYIYWVSINGRYPNSWMVYFMENPSING